MPHQTSAVEVNQSVENIAGGPKKGTGDGSICDGSMNFEVDFSFTR